MNSWQLIGFSVTALGGVILHYLYELLGNAVWIAPFSGVNESTWEHMKLLFWPMLIYAVIQSFFFGERKDYWCVKLRGIILGLVLIPVIFYTAGGVIGKLPDWFNITIFFLSAAIAYIFETYLFNKAKVLCRHPKIAFVVLIIVAVLFVVFTFFTPEIGLFRDPLTGTYGIPE